MSEATRRDILRALLGASAAALAGCRTREKIARYEGEFVATAMADGHRLRDGGLRPAPEATARRARILILGSGVAGLAAARELRRRGHDDLLILEAEDVHGGTSRSGKNEITAHPWGAHYLPAPPKENAELIELLREIGSVTGFDDDGEPIFREDHLTAAPKERVFFRGSWHEGIFPRSGATATDVEQMDRFERSIEALVRAGGFTIPIAHSRDDEAMRALDQMTMSEWLDREKLDSPMLRWWVEYATRDDFGTELSEVSAWYALHYFASRGGVAGSEFLTWPAGNGFLVDHLLERAGRDRLLAGKMIFAIEPAEHELHVFALDRATQKIELYVCERIICALPSFIRARLFPDTPWRPDYVPWLVAGVTLSERPGENGYPRAWDNVIYGSRSLGYVDATHQLHRDRGPTVWTWYAPFSGKDARAERKTLEALPWVEASSAVVAELARCHLDFERCVRRVDLIKWGHGMVRPSPGTAFSADRARAAAPRDRVFFAHTDLSGVALFEEAFFHGVRAARELSASLAG